MARLRESGVFKDILLRILLLCDCGVESTALTKPPNELTIVFFFVFYLTLLLSVGVVAKLICFSGCTFRNVRDRGKKVF